MNTVSIAPSPSWRPGNFFNLFPRKEKTEKVTLRENSKTYLVIAVLPGFIKDDIHINYNQGILNIYASSYLVSRTYTSTRLYGKRNIHKTIKLEREVDEENIAYLYESNVLRVWLPKKDRSKAARGLTKRFNLLQHFRKML